MTSTTQTSSVFSSLWNLPHRCGLPSLGQNMGTQINFCFQQTNKGRSNSSDFMPFVCRITRLVTHNFLLSAGHNPPLSPLQSLKNLCPEAHPSPLSAPTYKLWSLTERLSTLISAKHYMQKDLTHSPLKSHQYVWKSFSLCFFCMHSFVSCYDFYYSCLWYCKYIFFKNQLSAAHWQVCSL